MAREIDQFGERSRRMRIVRPRVVAYAALLAVVLVAFVAALARRQSFDLQVAHNDASLSMATADGRIGNAYTLHIQNRDRTEHRYHLTLDDPEGLELVAGMNPVTVPATSSLEARVFVLAGSARPGAPASRIRFVLAQESDPARRVTRESTFLSGAAAGRGDGR